MTVTPSTSDVADKAVSTDDVAGSGGMELARLEAVLAALVKAKVEAIKASSSLGKRCGSAPASPHRLRLTSTSTASSSLNHHHHHRRHGRKSHQLHLHQLHHRRRRHDSAPCGELIDDTHRHPRRLHHSKGWRRASESPRSPRKRRRHSRSPNPLHGVVQEVHPGLDSRFQLLAMELGEQDLALINSERAREALSDSCEYPRLHRSACYFSQSTAQLKMHYDDDDHVALNIADELEEEETLSGPGKMDEPRQKYHRPRKKRKRRRVVNPTQVEEIPDPDELPPRARWTIVATACLLLAMSLLLVGVTLRMAPIIDEMVRRENEELINSLNREYVPENTTAPP